MNPHVPERNKTDHHIKILCDHIKKEAGNIPSVHHFFRPYDCYDGRIFDIWELFIIFDGKIDERIFWELAEVDQLKRALKSG